MAAGRAGTGRVLADAAQEFAVRVSQLGADDRRALELAREALESLRRASRTIGLGH